MERIPVATDLSRFPSSVHPLLEGAFLYDSSCSPEARVWFIDRDSGYYLKTSASGSLKKEASLTDYFHRLGLAAQVLYYESSDADWLLTKAIPGEDCIHRQYLDDPKRLSETMGLLLRQLHETDFTDCPVPDRTADYIAAIRKNRHLGKWDLSLFPENGGFRNESEAWSVVQEFSEALKSDTLIHGDYCLPNIMLDNWNFSAFLDLGNAGVGDRHIDLFWGAWTLIFNLKTDAWCSRFLDAYGRDRFDPEILRAISAFEVFG